MTVLERLKAWVRWLQGLEPAWFRANSWVNEALGAGVLVTLLASWAAGPVWAVIGFNAVSLFYELVLDPWGWSLDDVGQRAAGSLLVGFVWLALR